MQVTQESIFPIFTKGQRVEVMQSAPTCIYGFGRIEADIDQRRGWYYVRFPQGEVEMVESVYLLDAPETVKVKKIPPVTATLYWTDKEGKVVPLRT